jgi:hypothetical protein
MKGSGVAQSYLDPLAVRIQSARLGKQGRGWKRFLVFAELTKSRKGADYVALFTFYSFEGEQSIRFLYKKGEEGKLLTDSKPGPELSSPKDRGKSSTP